MRRHDVTRYNVIKVHGVTRPDETKFDVKTMM